MAGSVQAFSRSRDNSPKRVACELSGDLQYYRSLKSGIERSDKSNSESRDELLQRIDVEKQKLETQITTEKHQKTQAHAREWITLNAEHAARRREVDARFVAEIRNYERLHSSNEQNANAVARAIAELEQHERLANDHTQRGSAGADLVTRAQQEIASLQAFALSRPELFEAINNPSQCLSLFDV
jgi:hypothetical protein